MRNLKPYMFFNRHIGPEEGAGLVFAHSSREARKIGWRAFSGLFAEEFIDIGVNVIKNSPWLLDEKQSDEPHAVLEPKGCKHCECWGQSPIGEDGLCESCREDFEILETRG